MTPADSRRVAALESQIAALTRQLGNARGLGVNTAFGATHYRTTQIGFEVEVTTAYDAATGYGWKRKRLVPGAAEPFTDPGVQPVGDKAFSFVDRRDLVPGMMGWLEPSPDAHGWILIHGPEVVSGSYSGSGSGTDVDGDGTADRRLVGYNYDVACVDGVLQKWRQPIYQFLGSGLTSYGEWEYAGTVGCCECDDDPSDGEPTGVGGTFPACDAVPTTLDWTCSSSDIACLDGQSGTITRAGTGSPYTWSNGNNLAPGCSTDNGFTIACTSPSGALRATVDSAAGATTFFVTQTATSLTFITISDGTGTLAAGSATFVVVIP